jgi:hypothetical protein
MMFDPNSIKFWGVWIVWLTSQLRIQNTLDYRAIQEMVWPHVPAEIKSVGYYSTLISGIFLLIDMVVAFLRSKF